MLLRRLPYEPVQQVRSFRLIRLRGRISGLGKVNPEVHELFPGLLVPPGDGSDPDGV